MKNDTETTTWTLGELCDYWRANLARLQASMDFRTLAALQAVFADFTALFKIGADNLYMPIDKAAEQALVDVPSWITKPEGKRGLPFRFRALAHVFSDSELRDGDLIAGELNAIAAEYDSTTNPFEKQFMAQMGIQAAGFPQFDILKIFAVLATFGPLLARIDFVQLQNIVARINQIIAMPQGKERIAATAKLVADISAAVAEMLSTSGVVKPPFNTPRPQSKKARAQGRKS